MDVLLQDAPILLGLKTDAMRIQPKIFESRRFSGELLLCLFFGYAALAAQKIELQSASATVGKFEKLELSIPISGRYSNPFDPAQVDVSLELTTPTGRQLHLPAFYCQEYERRHVGPAGRQRDWMYPKGPPVWKARFAPMEIGRHRAVAILNDASGAAASQPVTFDCVPSGRKGFLRMSRKDPRFFEFSEGQPFFAIGQNLAFIGEQQHVTLSKAEEIFAQLATNGANYLRIWTGCEDWAMAIEARKSAWGRSWDWHPPIVPMPEAKDTNTRCLKLSATRDTLKVDPSHPVALRPGTRYLVTGKIRTEEGAALRLEVQHTKRRISSASGRWTNFQHEFSTGPDELWLDPVSFHLEDPGAAWLTDLSLKEIAGGPELLWEADVNRPIRGFYNPVDCFMLDQILAAAEKQGLYLQLCLLTRDLYMNALQDLTRADYARAIDDAKKFFCYAVARWGYSTSVAAWEYWNEMNPGLPTDRFYNALGAHLEQVDIYRHLRTTSTWGPSARDCHHSKLDIADVHFYLRPSDKARVRDEVEAVLERTRWLREQAPNKPAHLGEFGLANDKWQPTEEMKQSRELADFHNALWASALSGSSGTGMFWWWERLDKLDAYRAYRPLSDFIADVPWNGGEIRPASIALSDERVRAIGLRTADHVWLWLFHRAASWSSIVVEKSAPPLLEKIELDIQELPSGSYHIQWWDTREGKVVREEKAFVADGKLHLAAPAFTRNIASRIRR